MEYRQLGQTELQVSRLCLGTMQFGWTTDEQQALRILSEAFEAGINFIDTADIYSRWAEGNPGGVSEKIIGRWLAQNADLRAKIILATKVRGNMGGGSQDEGLSRSHIMKSVEGSLKRLRTEHIDLYQAHWPDENTSIDETLRAYDDLVKQGKIRTIGASNYAAWQLMQALWTADSMHLVRYESLQPHYNLVHREEFERELQVVCKTYNIGVIPYSPLAGGFLTGKYRRNRVPLSARAGGVKKYFTEKNWVLLDRMDEIAREKNANLTQIALAWMLANPLVTSPIIGANSIEQLRDSLGSVDVHLTVAEKESLDSITAWDGSEE